jgi:putative Holliday junction resolvase
MSVEGGRLLGVDVGERRIGVAVSQGRIAVPLTIIEHQNRANDIARVVEIAEREQAEAIVVGLPVSLSGEEHEQARITRKFGAQLAEQAGIPVVLQDERFSTVQAEAAATNAPEFARHRSRLARQRLPQHYDDRAAAVILQSYIDSKQQTANSKQQTTRLTPREPGDRDV